MENLDIWIFHHHTALLIAILLAGLAIVAVIRRPRRWFTWAFDGVAAIAILVAVAGLWFFAQYDSTMRRWANTLTYASLDGGPTHRVSDLRGNVVLLNIWATWCGPCRREMPDLSRLADAYRGKGVVVLSLSDEEPEALRKFLAKYPQSMTVARFERAVAHGGVEGFAYRARPETLILDRDGAIRTVFIGLQRYDDFDAAIRAAM